MAEVSKKKFMINTIADLLEELREKEVQILDEQDLKHSPTIGDMYEGFTSDLLKRTIFKDLNLVLATGSFIRNIAGEQTNELDVVLAVGEGERIPYTDRFIFAPSQVVAVFQVKKQLYTDTLESSFLNLKTVFDICGHDNALEEFETKLFIDAFRSICHRDPYTTNWERLTAIERKIHGMLRGEAILPVRVVLGYHGFKHLDAFRNSYLEILNRNVTESSFDKAKGIGLISLPTHVICEKFSIIKINGMPFAAPMNNGTYLLAGSFPDKPFRQLLEYIWTRLSYQFGIAMNIFGEDLIQDQIDGLLLLHETEEGLHFIPYHIEKEDLMKVYEETQWLPVEISTKIAEFRNLLRSMPYDGVAVDNKEFMALADKENLSPTAFAQEICATELFFQDAGRLFFNGKMCATVQINGKTYLGDNISGRLERWAAKQIIRPKKL
jgi:hypothetical protein